MPRPSILSTALAGLPVGVICVASLALAQPPGAPLGVTRIQGVVTAVTTDSVTIRGDDGKVTVLPLLSTWTVSGKRPVDIEAIKPGSFVATANTNIDANTGKSIELRIFAPGDKGGEGSRSMTQANTTMTNATVTKVTKGAQGRELDVAYPGGVRHIIVPPDVQVIGNFPLDRSALKPGVKLTVLGVKGSDGVMRGSRLEIAEK